MKIQTLLTVMKKNNYVTLPQNLLLSPGTLLEDFETIGDWTANAHGIAAANTTQFLSGTQSIKLTDNDTSQVSMEKTVNLDMSSSWERLYFRFYSHDPITDWGSNSLQIYLGNNSSYSNAYRKYITTGNLDHNQNMWTSFYVHKTEFEKVGSGSWASAIVRLQLRFGGAASGKTPSVSFDSLYTGNKGIPAVCLTFDDGTVTQYTSCFSYMEPRGIRGTLWAIGSYVDSGDPYLTHQQIQEMAGYGWIIGNHTYTHTDLTTLTEAQQETEILNCNNALLGWGLSKGVKYLCLVNGNSNANTNTAMTNQGIVCARSTRGWDLNAIRLALPFYDLYRIPSDTSTGQSIATLTGLIDLAITCGYICTIHLHRVGDTDISVADFQTLIDYIYTKWKAGLIYPITIDDYYKLTLGPVKVPK